MAAKSKKNSGKKIRVSKKVNKTSDNKLFIALAVLLIAIVAVAGIVYYRQSQAAVWPTAAYDDFVVEGGGYDWNLGTTCMRLQSSGRWCDTEKRDGNIRNAIMWARMSDGRCATIWNKSAPQQSKWNYGAEHTYFPVGTRVSVAEYYYGQKACSVSRF